MSDDKLDLIYCELKKQNEIKAHASLTAWDVQHVAIALGCSVCKARELVKQPDFPSARLVGKTKTWKPSEVTVWYDKQEAAYQVEMLFQMPLHCNKSLMSVDRDDLPFAPNPIRLACAPIALKPRDANHEKLSPECPPFSQLCETARQRYQLEQKTQTLMSELEAELIDALPDWKEERLAYRYFSRSLPLSIFDPNEYPAIADLAFRIFALPPLTPKEIKPLSHVVLNELGNFHQSGAHQ